MNQFLKRFDVAAAVLAATLALPAQGPILDASWTVTIGGQQAQVNNDGTVLIPNVAAPDQFGPGGPGTPPDFLSDDFLQLIGTRVVNGVTEYAFSEHFQIRRGQPYRIRGLTITTTPPPTVVSLDLAAADPVMTGAIGQTTQLTTLGTLNDGSIADLTPRSAWTVYRTSNPLVATVGQDGLVTSTGPGTVFFTAVNDGTSAVTRVVVSPADPLTTVEGYAQLEGGVPLPGAQIDIPAFGSSALSGPDGRFIIPNVPSLQGNFIVTGRFTTGTGNLLFASTPQLTPVPGGVTDAGILVLTEPGCQFDPVLGVRLPLGDDQVRFVTFGGGFTFAYFGVSRPDMWISSNGNLQFGGFGETTFNPSVPQGVVNGVARISPAFFDLHPGQGGGVYLKEEASRVVVTWFQIPEYNTGGSNTIQCVLYTDGRIDIIYNGISHLGTTFRRLNVAVSPGGSPTVRNTNFSGETPFAFGGTTAPIESFGQVVGNPFDLDFQCLTFTPNAAGGYDAVLRPLPTIRRDGLAMGVMRDGQGGARAFAPFVATSSSDPTFRLRGVTDALGCFRIQGAPRPGVLQVWGLGQDGTIASAAALIRTSYDLPYLLVAPTTAPNK